MRIFVTQEDIDKGVPNDDCKCPVALAISRVRSTADVHVDRRYIDVGYQSFTTPEPASAFIRAFDAGQPVEPFEFEL